MFAAALAFCGGAACLYLVAGAPRGAAPALAVAALLCRRRPWLAGAACGLAWAIHAVAPRIEGEWSCRRDREVAALDGIVASPALVRTGRVDFDFDARTPQPMRVRVAWYEAEALPLPGERWQLTLRLRCRRGLANRGAPDRELSLLRQGIGATGYVLADPPPVRLAAAGRQRGMQQERARIAAHIESAAPGGPSAAVLQGLSVGLRGNVPERLWDAFAATGVAHLMAISGLHVTGCALCMLIALRVLRRLPGAGRIPGWAVIETGAVVGATAAYAWLAGASEPALRTVAMVSAVAACRLARRAIPVHEALALAALALVAADPLSLSSAGFWLSFAATAALIAVAAAPTGWAGRAASFLRAQAAILVLLAPVLAAAFGRLSLVAPFANAIAIPLFSLLLLPGVLGATLLELALPAAAAPMWHALGSGLDRLWPALLSMAQWPLAEFAPVAPAPWLVAAAVAAAMAALLLPTAGVRILAGVLALALAGGGSPRPVRGDWTLTVFDVGQGLSALVETGRHAVLFDTGPAWRGGGAAAAVSVVPALRARGIRRIDRLIVSHADADHAGGAVSLRTALPVAWTLAPAGAQRAGGDRECRRGDHWRYDGVEFRMLHPPQDFEASENDRSCALLVAGPAGRALLLADPEARAEALLGRSSIAADVVLLPHHGSRSSSTPALVAAVGARIGIASAGHGNRWGMPDPQVVARWRAAGTTVLTTAAHGAITVRAVAAHGAPSVETERERARRWWRRPPGD